MTTSSGRAIAAGLLAVTVAACGTATRAAPPEPDAARPAASPAGVDVEQRRYTDADVRFMQRMIPHHAQALTMASLVPARADRDAIRLLAERIAVSQQDEIAMIRRWLEKRGEEIPPPDAHHGHHGAGQHAAMAGMLSPEELARLEAARGPEFDRLFLEYMIRHHEGALMMVDELFASGGAGQEPDIFRIASEVDADQRAEIERMRRVLSALSAGETRR